MFEIKDEPQIEVSLEETKISPQPIQQNQTPQQITQPPNPSVQTQSSPSPANPAEPKIIEKPIEIIKEVVKEVPVEKIIEKEVRVIDEEKVNQKAEEKLFTELELRRRKANATRLAKKQKKLDRLTNEVRNRGKFTSQEAQQFFDIPQSTLGDYFHILVSNGTIKQYGKGRGTYYTP